MQILEKQIPKTNQRLDEVTNTQMPKMEQLHKEYQKHHKEIKGQQDAIRNRLGDVEDGVKTIELKFKKLKTDGIKVTNQQANENAEEDE